MPAVRAVTRHVLVVALLASGCSLGSFPVERTLGGVRRAGVFVPPYAYEHFLRGELASAAADWPRAANEYALARSGGDDDPLLAARHAVALARSGDEDGAARALAEGRALDEDAEAVHLAASEIAALRGDGVTALEEAERAVRAAPGSRAAALHLAAQLENAGDRESAARVLSALAAAPVELWIEAALGAGDVERAMGLARRTLLDRAARVRLAARLAGPSVDRPVLADELLGPLRGQPPESDAERRLRIEVALALGAVEEVEGLLAVPPRAGGELDDARAWLRIGQHERAEALARGALALSPSTEADVILAAVLLAAGRPDEAAALAVAVPAASSHAPEAGAIVAEALRRSGLTALADEVGPGPPAR